jgi:tetratricopeptide (TPR) repeat protein
VVLQIIDPFDQTETEMKSDEGHINDLYKKSFIIYKLIIMVITFAIIIILVAMVFKQEDGIVTQPFETTEKNLSGVFIADFLSFELNEIKEINANEIAAKKSTDASHSISGIPLTSNVTLKAKTLSYQFSKIGNIGIEGTSLSLGQLLLSLKTFFNNNERTLTGCIQRSGSDLHIIAILDDPSGGAAWNIKAPCYQNKNLSDDDLSSLLEDLSFKIVIDLNKQAVESGKIPRTWEAFKNSTMSIKAYNRYNVTRDIVDLDRASELALLAKRSEPSYSESCALLSFLGNAHLALNNESNNESKKAEQLFQNAIELNSSYANAWSGMGLALYYQKKYNDSIYYYNRSIGLDPLNSYAAWNNKGLVLVEINDIPEAIQAYEKAVKLNNLSAIWINIGNAKSKMGQDSIGDYNKAIEKNPKSSIAWYNKGLALDNQWNYDEAIRAYDNATYLDPTGLIGAKAWYGKGYVLEQKSDYDQAIWAFNKSIEIDPQFEKAWFNEGCALYMLKKYDKANQAYDKAIKLDPKDETAWYNKCVALKDLNRPAEAKAAFETSKKLGYKGQFPA